MKKREMEAVNKIVEMFGLGSEEYFEFINEFEEKRTKEAKIARELDTLEMLFQASEYEKNKNYKKIIWKYWIDTHDLDIQNPELRKILNQLKEDMK